MTADHATTLAAGATTSVLLWAGVLIVVAMIGGFVISIVRRNMLGDGPTQDDGSMMDQLRKMVDQGQMTQEEFDLARRKIIERASGGKSTGPAKESGSETPDVTCKPDDEQD